jgi:hypothetical protein
LPTAVPPARLPMDTLLAAVERWFLASGITEPCGGVARYHYSDRRENARVSTEITGYAVSSLLDIHARTGSDAARDGALRSARFLCRDAWDPALDAMPFEWAPDGRLPEHATYFFDNGIIARALLRAWRLTGEAEFLDTAIACGHAMQRDFVNHTDIHPILDLPAKTPRARDARWSRTSDCYQMKSALAWHGLAAATGDAAWLKPFELALERSLATHAAFPDGEPGARTMDRLHAYGYFLEALLARAAEADVRRALDTGIRAAGERLRRWRGEFERSDVPAQLLRVRLWAHALGAVALDEAAAAEEAAWAARYATTGEAHVDGSFCFGSRAGAPMPFANPVSTAFCAQALALYDGFLARRPLPDWSTLV